MMKTVDLGVAVVEPRRLAQFESLAALDAPALAAFLEAPEVAALAPAGAAASHLYFGSEFCEHLFPDAAALERAIGVAQAFGLTLVLATPVANDELVARIVAAAALLPPTAEVLVNDWGVASALRAAQPQRRLAAGRQLAKAIKDPRLPSPAWTKPYATGYATAGYRRVMESLGIGRIELDVPPFATPATFAVDAMAVSVWAPFGYVAKGRLCKIGSLQLAAADKFAPGAACHRECLGVVEAATQPSAAGIESWRRGNSLYYRHDAAMANALRAALAAGRVDRLVFAGI
ncbi:MAG: hypothetical protein PHY45_00500 [Rhodocyclaceae bacterium]|nr:hypothetical protein [Rhodocyclaceae bacterium]